MLHVIASIHINEGRMADALEIYQPFVPEVLAEKGCIMYCPTTDVETAVATQEKDGSIITVVEQWADMESFLAHLSAPHVLRFREQMKGILDRVSIKVLKAV